jgi:hypothetical protein
MVTTRAGRRRLRAREQSNREFWNQIDENGWEQMLQTARRGQFPKKYWPNDYAHRHRKHDRQDKDVVVRSHTRRS